MNPPPQLHQNSIVFLGTKAEATLRFRTSLIQWFVKHDFTVYVFAHDYTDTTRVQIKRLGAVPLDSPFNRAGLTPLQDLSATFCFAAQLKKLKPQMILTYFAKPIIFGTFAATLARVPNRFALFEGLGYAFTDRPRWSLRGTLIHALLVCLFKPALFLLKGALFLNEDDRDALCSGRFFKPKKNKILKGIGVPSVFFRASPVPIKPFTFLFVGRLIGDKGIREFVEASAIVKKRYPEVCFQVVGDLDLDNPSALSHKAYLKLKESSPHITWVGTVKNIRPVLKEASMLVLPSYREGSPRTIQEAMAMGRPVLTTRVPGCRQTVQEGKTGFLVPPHTPVVLAQKMVYCFKHQGQIRLMGKHAHNAALDHYKEDDICAEILAFFTDRKQGASPGRALQSTPHHREAV